MPATVSGLVFLDNNGDGLRQSGEAGTMSCSVQLVDVATGMGLMMPAGMDGSYSFAGVPAGSYRVVVIPMNLTLQFGPKDQGGDDTIDSDVDATGKTDVFTLVAGQVKGAVAALVLVGPIAPIFVVTKTADDGTAGTLRWAIQEANTRPGSDTIVFDIGAQAVGLRRDAVAGVVAGAPHVVERVGDGGGVAVAVVGRSGAVPQCVGAGGQAAVAVVGQRGRVAQRVGTAGQQAGGGVGVRAGRDGICGIRETLPGHS